MRSSSSSLWKSAATKRASEFAAKIMNDAELRARLQWEASHIQILAIKTAKSEATLARTKAEEAKYLLETASVSVEHTELMRKQAFAAYQEERTVQASSSWKLQMKTVSWIIKQSEEYGA